MDLGSKVACAKQCFLYTAVTSFNGVLYGSAAADRYLDPSMRFGESGSHQDLDLFLVLPDEDAAYPEHIDQFMTAVSEVTACVMQYNEAVLTYTVKMNCNGLYTANVCVNQAHFADVTLISESVNAKVASRFPRVPCDVFLPVFKTTMQVMVLSFDEVLHRLVSIVASKPLIDELPILPASTNKAAIVKAALRLDRIQKLLEMGLVFRKPQQWSFETSLCAIPDELLYVQNGALMPAMGKPKVVQTIISAAFMKMETMMAALQSTCLQRCEVVQGKLSAAEASARKLVVALNARVNRESDVARSAIQKVAETLKMFRTATFISATKPIKALKDLIELANETASTAQLVRLTGGGQDPSLGDYLESYTRISNDMSRQNCYPFCMFKGFDFKMADPKEFPSMSRDACAVNGMKMNIMASFVMFLKMLRISNGQTDDLVRHKFADYSEWSSMSRFTIALAKRADAMKEFVKPKETCVPIVSAADASIDFIVMTEAAESHTSKDMLGVMHKVITDNLVPQLDYANVDFIMAMLDNVIGSITCPLVAHIGKLKETLSVLEDQANEIAVSGKEYIDELAKNPFIVQVQLLKAVQDDIVHIGKKLSCQDVFSWSGRKPTKKSKSKRKV